MVRPLAGDIDIRPHYIVVICQNRVIENWISFAPNVQSGVVFQWTDYSIFSISDHLASLHYVRNVFSRADVDSELHFFAFLYKTEYCIFKWRDLQDNCNDGVSFKMSAIVEQTEFEAFVVNGSSAFALSLDVNFHLALGALSYYFL